MIFDNLLGYILSISMRMQNFIKIFQTVKELSSSKLRSKFETLRREIKADVRKQHDLYVNNLVGDVKANPRDFYRYINSQKKDTQGIPPLKRKNGKGVAQSDLEKAEEFNGQFTDVFSKNEHTQVPLLDRSAPFMNDIAVSKDGVIKLLKGFDNYDYHKQINNNFNSPQVTFRVFCTDS